MLDDSDSPALEVGFAIDGAGAIEELMRLQSVMDSTEGRLIADAAKIERATRGMVNVGAASAAVTAFGNAAAPALRAVAQEAARVEKAGERMVVQLERQNASFGKTRTELQSLRAEELATAAARAGNADLAERLRAAELTGYSQRLEAARKLRFEQEAAAQDAEAEASRRIAAAQAEARALRDAAAGVQAFEQAARRQAQANRDAADAATRDANAVARLREMADPAAASQARLADATEEARRLMIAAGFSAEEMVRVEKLLEAQHGNVTRSSGMMRSGMQQLSFQLNDVASGFASGQPPMMIFAQQSTQVVQALQLMAGETKGFLGLLAGPWGSLITAAVVVLAPFVMKLFESGDASDAAAKGHDKHAAAAFNLIGAIRELNAALSKEVMQSQSTLAASFNAAVQLRNQEIATRNLTKARLDGALAELGVRRQQAALSGDRGDIAGLGMGVAATQAAGLQAMLAQQNAAIGVAQQNVQLARMPILQRQVKEATDASAKATGDYDRAVARLGAQFLRHGVSAGEYRTRLEALTRQHMAAESAIKAQGGASNALSDAQAKAMSAHTGVQKAEAELALVRAHANADLKAGTITEAERTAKIAAAQSGVYAARDAEQSLRHERSEQAKAVRQAATEERELQALYDRLIDKINPVGAAYNRYSDELADVQKLQKGGLIGEQAAMEWRFNAMNTLQDKLAEIKRAQGDLPGWGKISVADQIASGAKDIVGILDKRGPLAVMKQQTDEARKAFDKLGDVIERVAGNVEHAFGRAGGAVGGVMRTLTAYRKVASNIAQEREAAAGNEAKLDALRRQSTDNQIATGLGLISSVKNLAGEHSKAYRVMEAAEKALTLVQLARTAVAVAEGAAQMFAAAGPAGFALVGAMMAVMAAVGFGSGSPGISKTDYIKGNTGTGTVLGDSTAGSDSIARSIAALKEVDTITSVFARQMAASLKSIDSQIGGLATVLVRSTNLSADGSITQGFKSSLDSVGGTAALVGIGAAIAGPIGAVLGAVLTKIPVIGDLLKGLFGTKTTVIGSGIAQGGRSIGDILDNGFNAQTYSDVEKKKKFFGITTSTKYSTVYGGSVDDNVNQQFYLILKSFNDAILAAAGPLGAATDDIKDKVAHFVFDLGKVQLDGLSGDEIQKKLSAIFGAAADGMAQAAFPFISEYQKVGEGAFETLTRVATTVEAVTMSLDQLGRAAGNLGIGGKMALADRFDSVSAFTDATSAYFASYYDKAEQAASRTAQLTKVMGNLGLALPDTLAGFRALVDAQDLTTEAGQATWATLIKLAPAFADLKTSLEGAKSAADIMAEREDLNQKLLQLTGDTAAIRAAELAKLDPSNRALQQQIYAIQDAQEAAKAAEQLRDAWRTVGDSLLDEVRRIRGLSSTAGTGTFASLMGQFNAANSAARAGDQDAAKSLPSLSKSLLDAAALAATSRQELDRVQAQTAATLEATYAVVSGLATDPTAATTGAATSAAAAATPTSSTADAGAATVEAIEELRAEVASLKDALVTIVSNSNAVKRKLDDVTAASGGDAISIQAAA